MAKPDISFQTFSGMNLQVGTAVRVRTQPEVPGLAVVAVKLDREVDALVPMSAVQHDLPGRQVVVSTGLHALTVGKEEFTCCLLSVLIDGREEILLVEDGVPDGSTLF